MYCMALIFKPGGFRHLQTIRHGAVFRRQLHFPSSAHAIVSSCQREMTRGLRGSQIWGLD